MIHTDDYISLISGTNLQCAQIKGTFNEYKLRFSFYILKLSTLIGSDSYVENIPSLHTQTLLHR